jgi:hypothetical protein
MKPGFRLLANSLFATALIACVATAQEEAKIRVSERDILTFDRIDRRHTAHLDPTHQLMLTLVYFTGNDWPRTSIVKAARSAAEIFEQCGISLRHVELVRVDAPERYRYLDTPLSRELARTLNLSRPTVYFVTDTRHQPAFDAEAIGRGNSRTRPELADTVWITRATRDLRIALAHELVHVLLDSGEHVELPDNLMRDETAPNNTRLTTAQCAQMQDVSTKNGLLRAIKTRTER